MAIFGVVTLAIVLLIGFMRAPQDWNGKRPILSSYVVVLIGVAVYILLPSILILVAGTFTWADDYYSEENFARAIWLCVLALVVFLYANSISRRFSIRKQSRSPHRPLVAESSQNDRTGRSADVLLIFLLVCGLLLKLVLIVSTGGIEHSITRFSGYAREFSGVETLDAGEILLRTISGIADGAATWGVLRALRDRHRERTWFLILLLTLALSYVTIGKRLVLLLPLVCVVIGVHVYRRQLTTRLLPVVLAVSVAIGFVTLNARVFLPASIVGYNINLDNVAYAQGSALQFYLYSLEFSSVEMISVAMLSRQDIVNMFDGPWNAFITTNLEPFLYSVPRLMWPGKPDAFYDLSYGVSAALGATPFEDPTVGYASTIIGTSYLLGGVIGVIVTMLLLGVLTGQVDRELMRMGWPVSTLIVYALILVIVFHLFRQGTLGWTFIVSITQSYGAIGALLLLSYVSRDGGSAQVPPAFDPVAKQCKP